MLSFQPVRGFIVTEKTNEYMRQEVIYSNEQRTCKNANKILSLKHAIRKII
jgi:hypothetical protein